MLNFDYKKNLNVKRQGIFTKRHYEIIQDLEKMLEKGVPDLTMSQIASNLKISLRTLYEIAPSKDELIIMITDSILRKHGKHALESISDIKSPLKKLEKYLFTVNQVVGPKFNTFFKDIEKIKGLEEIVDYHANFITNLTEELLNQSIETNEIQYIDSKAFSILLGGIGREFIKEKNRLSESSPEESANSITSIILNGIKLRN
jgi:AcrR family transcriptional regulator